MSSEEVCGISLEDVQNSLKLLKEIPEYVTDLTDSVQDLINQVKNGEFSAPKGLSFLDVKSNCFLSYIINLSFLIMKKIASQKIEGDPAINRLIETRIVLEKMKPIEERLKYQINKMISFASSGKIEANHPLHFRANPDDFDIKDDEDNECSNDEVSEEEVKTPKVYVPPKISAAYYDGDDTLEMRKKKLLERAQKKALSSSMLYELRKEYDTGPEEIRETTDHHKIKLNEEMKARQRYEEEYMLRLPMTKKQKHEAKQLTTITNFNTKFEDISALELRPEDMTLKKKTKKRFSKNKVKKKGFKKKH